MAGTAEGQGQLAARLSDLGFHLTEPASKPTISAELVGEIRADAVEAAWTTADQMRVWDKERSMLVERGKIVYLSGDGRGKPAEIGEVTDFYLDTDGNFWLVVAWFWRPSMIKLPRNFEKHQCELFKGADEDENPIEALELCDCMLLSSPCKRMAALPHEG